MRSGIFGRRVGWFRRAESTGRHSWGPGNDQDGLAVGGAMGSQGREGSTVISGVQYLMKMFYDPSTGAFRAGAVRILSGETDTWDLSQRGQFSTALGMSVRAAGFASAAIGHGNIASGQYSVAVCQGSNASGIGAFAAVGGQASGNGAAALGGVASSTGAFSCNGGTASGWTSFASGSNSLAPRYSQRSHASGQFASFGDAQFTRMVLRIQTTDATATEVDAQAGAADRVTIGATRTMSFHIKLAAHRTDVSGTAAAWPQIFGGITRDSSGNCRLLGSVTGAGTTSLCDAGASTWSVAVTADSTNNRLAITVTGEAAKTIRWVASVEMAEVG